MSRSRRKNSGLKVLLIVLTVLILSLLIIYCVFAKFYSDHYFPNTTVNGIDVGNKTPEYVREVMQDRADEYLLTVIDRVNDKYFITGREIGNKFISIGEEDKILDEQKFFSWPSKVRNNYPNTIAENQEYDDYMMDQAINGLGCLKADKMIAPENAHIGETDTGYEIVPETDGTLLIFDNMYSEVKKAIDDRADEVTLSDKDYVKASITKEDPTLNECINTINHYVTARITYDLDNGSEVLDSTIIKDWIILDEENFQVSLDETKVRAYVQSLASKYNTYADKREFKTTKGDIITIGGGDYGWIVDKEGEYEQLLSDLYEGLVTTREMVYSQRAMEKGLDDIGDTYIEIDYTNQHLYYYENGTLMIHDDIVSGNISRNNGSPDGVFKIVYKQSPATLKGEDYSSDVEFFMPFAYNVGIHDASWRSVFGGTEYINSGSHGCINMRRDTVVKLYDIVAKGTPVVAYYREPVVLTAENAKISNAYSYQAPETEETTNQ